MRGNKKLFLSAVSSELASYRSLLATDLKRPDLDVAVQEDFVVGGGTTLEKLDTYLRHCDAVIHLIGKAAGAVPEGPAVAALLAEYPDLGARLPGTVVWTLSRIPRCFMRATCSNRVSPSAFVFAVNSPRDITPPEYAN